METKENTLGTEQVGKLMVKFAVPSIIAMLVGALYNIVDQFFIGQAVGTDGNAATNIAFPLSTMCISLSLMFGVGGASCYNLSLGEGDREKAPFYIGNSFVMLGASGLLLCLITELLLTPMLIFFGSPDRILPYAQEYVGITAFGFPFLILATGGGHLIRADGSPGMTMFCNIIGAVVNTGLDALFVFGFNWGMSGAAAATIIGQVVSALIVAWYVFFRFKSSKLTKEHFIPAAKHITRIVSIGLASFFNQISMMIVQIVVNNELKYYGSLSEYGDSIPLAAAGIIMKVNHIVFSFVIGLGQGSQPIESFNYGARKYDRVRKALLMASAASIVIASVALATFQIMPREILSMFGTGSEEYFTFGEKFFRIFLLCLPIVSIQPVASTFFTSIGKPIKGILLSLTRQILFFLPLIVILPLFMGIEGILYSGPAADTLSGITTIIMVLLEFRALKKLAES